MTKNKEAEITFVAHVSEGKLVLPLEAEVDMAIQFAKLEEGDKVKVSITPLKQVRSLNQNAYYWGVVLPAIRNGLRELGLRLSIELADEWVLKSLVDCDQATIHRHLKNTFCDKTELDWSKGIVIKKIPSTAEMTSEEFSDYISQVIQWANEVLEIEIPSNT